MSSVESPLPAGGGGLLDELKKSRSRSAVLKSQLVILKSSLRNPIVFVFEGPEDKTVYHHWICKINHKISYEPFVCNGKSQVLKLFAAVKKDLNGLDEGVYFFVDRDFDPVDVHPKSPELFLTEAYAVENYLVRSETVVELLRTHFHFVPDIDFRNELVALFSKLYDEFLKVTHEVNFRSFVCRHLNIDAVPGLPKKLSKLAVIDLEEVSPSVSSAEETIKYQREPSVEDLEGARVVFSQLKAKRDYRGKYAMMFFMRWLDLLVRDRNSENSVLFKRVKTAEVVAPVNLDCLASRSVLPPGLHDFLNNVPVRV